MSGTVLPPLGALLSVGVVPFAQRAMLLAFAPWPPMKARTSTGPEWVPSFFVVSDTAISPVSVPLYGSAPLTRHGWR